MHISRRQALQLSAAFGASLLPLGQALAQSADKPKTGGVLTTIAVGEPTTLVPLLDSNTRTRTISTKILEGLVSFDEKFNPRPVLATSWSVSDDGLRYTFNLRPGVKWHDGKDFTSEDVRFSLLAFKKAGPRGRITFQNITDIETPDQYTAIVVLSKPTPFLLRALTGGETPILAAHTYSGDDFAASRNGNNPIGTGPFKFEEWVRGSHVSLSRNPDYWQPGLPHLDGVVARFVGDAAAATIAIETGEVHLSTDVSLVDLERLKQNSQIAVDTYTDAYLNNAQVFEFNLENPILAKADVRHALAHAIDRQFIIDAIYFGTAKAAGSTIPAVFSTYNDEAPFQYAFDPQKAAELFDKAGYEKKGDGFRFSLKLAFMPGDAFRKTAEYFRSAFAKVGVKIEVLDGDLATYIKRVYNERGFDLNLNGISRLFDPTTGVQRLYWSDGIKNVAPYVNAAHYNNPQVDDLFRAAAVEQDDEKRAELFRKIQVIVGADLPNFAVIALPTVITRSAAAKNVVTTIDVGSSDFAQAWLDQ